MTGTWPEYFKPMQQNKCNTTNLKNKHDRKLAGTRPRALQRKQYRNIVMQIMDKTTRQDQLITKTHQVRTPVLQVMLSFKFVANKYDRNMTGTIQATHCKTNMSCLPLRKQHYYNMTGTKPEHCEHNIADTLPYIIQQQQKWPAIQLARSQPPASSQLPRITSQQLPTRSQQPTVKRRGPAARVRRHWTEHDSK